jgi:hypothetical protein
MGQSIEQRGRHLGVAEDARPLGESQVGRDDDRGALVKPADQMKQQLAAGLGEGQLADLIEHDEVEPGQINRRAGAAQRGLHFPAGTRRRVAGPGGGTA